MVRRARVVSNGDRPAASFSDRLLRKVVCAGLDLNDRSICGDAIKSTMAQLPQPDTAEAIDRFGFRNYRTSKMMTLQLTSTQDSNLQRFNHAIQHFQSMDQMLQARIGTYTVYGQVVDRSELVLNDVLKWAKDQVVRDLSSKRIISKADGVKVVEVAHECGESYLIKKCVDCNLCGLDGSEAKYS